MRKIIVKYSDHEQVFNVDFINYVDDNTPGGNYVIAYWHTSGLYAIETRTETSKRTIFINPFETISIEEF